MIALVSSEFLHSLVGVAQLPKQKLMVCFLLTMRPAGYQCKMVRGVIWYGCGSARFLNDFNNLQPVHCGRPGNEARLLQELNSME